MAFYVICDDDSRHESMTKEQILSAITQAIETGSVGNCDTGFVTKVKETNGGSYVTFWVGTQAQYNALENKVANCLYIITDETTADDIEKMCVDAVNKAEEALRTLAEGNSINFTAGVELTMQKGAPNLLFAGLIPLRFEYNPCTRLVHFLVELEYAGMVDEKIVYSTAKGVTYKGAEGTGAYPVCSDDNRFSASAYIGEDDKFYIEFRPTNEAIATDIDEHKFARFSGWYFAGKN